MLATGLPLHAGSSLMVSPAPYIPHSLHFSSQPISFKPPSIPRL